ncbi:ABC transporter ATP-binding protein [Anthocerotibacter panamensis]|uniref:ABC transporter ATP-binding protein n=1 Tax=Anthocerotibacter panamensis TaxID=2857077 RepID=UPI001C404A67|nr:ABC transporter ATP-binding protein [Anthocerotibacter panamensis]
MSALKDILYYFRPYFRITVLSIAIVSVLEVLELTIPYATGQIVNVLAGGSTDPFVGGLTTWVSALTGQPVGRNLMLMVLLGVVACTTVLVAPIQPWVGEWFSWDTAFRARRDHFEKAHRKILTLPLEYFDQNNSGRLAGRIARGIANHTWTFPDIAQNLLPKGFRILGVFVLMLWIDLGVALFFGLSFLLITTYNVFQLKGLIAVEERLDRYAENTESRTSELITNIKTVRAFVTEEEELARQCQRHEREFTILDYKVHQGYVRLTTVRRSFVQCCVFGILCYTLWQVVGERISIGHFITLLTITSIAYAEVTPIGIIAEVFARRLASMLRFHDFLGEPTHTDAQVLQSKPVPQYQFMGQVEVRGLSFGYSPERLVLKDLHLVIAPKQTVALVGRSGSGKSTLIKLLLRYFEPSGGQVLVDGQDIRTLDVRGLRRRLAIVHQDVDIFNDTLLANLTYGNPHVTLAQVERACRMARVDEFLNLFAEGYQTVVGERGVRLSGGQKQRLGIARALICDPDILIFDEATSSLDYESERAIQLAMQDILGTRTVIIIAHRLSTVRDADQIVVFDDGRIAETGNHAQLLQQNGIYAHLHRLQADDQYADTDVLFALSQETNTLL